MAKQWLQRAAHRRFISRTSTASAGTSYPVTGASLFPLRPSHRTPLTFHPLKPVICVRIFVR
jgi:hypothetical protein